MSEKAKVVRVYGSGDIREGLYPRNGRHWKTEYSALLHDGDAVGPFMEWMVGQVMQVAREQEIQGWIESARELRDIAQAIRSVIGGSDE